MTSQQQSATKLPGLEQSNLDAALLQLPASMQFLITQAHTTLIPTNTVFIQVTPELAREMLAKGTLNRNINPRIVDRYARAMMAGTWIEKSPESIKFNELGELIDGQHRLHALLKASATLIFKIDYNCPSEVMSSLDSGSKRTPGQAAKIAGLNASNMEMAIVRAMHLKSTAYSSHDTFSNHELMNMYRKHQEAVTFAVTQYRKLNSDPMRSSILRGIVARAWYSQDKERLQRFLYVVDTRDSVASEDSAAIVLRNTYEKSNRSLTLGPEGRMNFYRLCTRALVHFLDCQPVKILRPMDEQPFPVSNIDDVPSYLWSKL